MRKNNPWLIYAREDYEALDLLSSSNLHRTICFHSQQLAEKSIKAAPFEKEIKVPRTHNITYLLSLFDLNFPIEKSDMEFLSTIYIESRYPPDIGLLSSGDPAKDDADRAIRIAKNIYEYIIKII
jgi:HEPN domain-containing protein